MKASRLKRIEERVFPQLEQLANHANIPLLDVLVRFRLLLPLSIIYPFIEMPIDEICDLLYKKVVEEVQAFSIEMKKWNELCGNRILYGCSPLHYNLKKVAYVCSNNGEEILLRVKDVNEGTGKYIEKNMHYLHSVRNDAVIRKGIFLEGHSFPILYACIIRVSDHKKLDLIHNALGIPENEDKRIYELSRVVGSSCLPRNTISFFIADLKRELLQLKATYFITAINEFLGFNGSSIKASGFKYLTERDVVYSYGKDFSYIGPLDKKSNVEYYMDNSSFKNKLYYISLINH